MWQILQGLRGSAVLSPERGRSSSENQPDGLLMPCCSNNSRANFCCLASVAREETREIVDVLDVLGASGIDSANLGGLAADRERVATICGSGFPRAGKVYGLVTALVEPRSGLRGTNPSEKVCRGCWSNLEDPSAPSRNSKVLPLNVCSASCESRALCE